MRRLGRRPVLSIDTDGVRSGGGSAESGWAGPESASTPAPTRTAKRLRRCGCEFDIECLLKEALSHTGRLGFVCRSGDCERTQSACAITYGGSMDRMADWDDLRFFLAIARDAREGRLPLVRVGLRRPIRRARGPAVGAV